ncbi:MAG: hypothetical protein FJW40_19180 [Acidobacteria bacterium]|nr:hypothetical protein [Acidobacteriota bacterium]
MTRFRLLAPFLAAACSAAVLPEEFAGRKRTETAPTAAPDPQLWAEYGFEQGEEASYGAIRLTGWRFRDTTGSLAAFQALFPEDGIPVRSQELAAATSTGEIWAAANYLFRLTGNRLKAAEKAALKAALKPASEAPLPTLRNYPPPQGLIPGSRRYITGPVALGRFLPVVPAAQAGFDFGAEIQTAAYRAGGSQVTLAIFSFPNMVIAREREKVLSEVPEVLVRRSGPLVALLTSTSPLSANLAAQELIAKVDYKATVMWNEAVPGKEPNPGDLLIGIFTLAGVLIGVCVGTGALFAIGRRMIYHYGGKNAQEVMVRLNIDERGQAL